MDRTENQRRMQEALAKKGFAPTWGDRARLFGEGVGRRLAPIMEIPGQVAESLNLGRLVLDDALYSPLGGGPQRTYQGPRPSVPPIPLQDRISQFGDDLREGVETIPQVIGAAKPVAKAVAPAIPLAVDAAKQEFARSATYGPAVDAYDSFKAGDEAFRRGDERAAGDAYADAGGQGLMFAANALGVGAEVAGARLPLTIAQAGKSALGAGPGWRAAGKLEEAAEVAGIGKAPPLEMPEAFTPTPPRTDLAMSERTMARAANRVDESPVDAFTPTDRVGPEVAPEPAPARRYTAGMTQVESPYEGRPPVDVQINPSQADIGRMVREQKALGGGRGGAKWAVDKDGNLYVWPAEANHDDVAGALGLEWAGTSRGSIELPEQIGDATRAARQARGGGSRIPPISNTDAILGIAALGSAAAADAMDEEEGINPITLAPAIFIGAIGARNLAKATGKTELLDKMAKAEQMAAQGASREDIWSQTGWFKGVDGKWRTEIDDSQAFVKGGDVSASETAKRWGPRFVGDYSSGVMAHPELADAYPELRDVTFQGKPGVGGNFERVTTLLPDPNNPAEWGGVVRVGDAYRGEQKTSVALHEGQHAVQDREGFARGGSVDEFKGGYRRHVEETEIQPISDKINQIMAANPDAAEAYRARNRFQAELMGKYGSAPGGWGSNATPQEVAEFDRLQSALQADPIGRELDSLDWDRQLIFSRLNKATPGDEEEFARQRYKSLAGEVESRNVETRRDMSMPERMVLPPWATQDVPDEQQIVRFGSGTAASVGDDFKRIEQLTNEARVWRERRAEASQTGDKEAWKRAHDRLIPIADELTDLAGHPMGLDDPSVASRFARVGEDFTPDATLISEAVKRFGTTTVPEQAGYILPDGRMLNFGEYGIRGEDHRAVAGLPGIVGDQTAAMTDFMNKTGAVRVDLASGLFETQRPPTQRQIETAVRAARKKGLSLRIEASRPDGSSKGSIDLDRPTTERVASFFEEQAGGKKFFNIPAMLTPLSLGAATAGALALGSEDAEAAGGGSGDGTVSPLTLAAAAALGAPLLRGRGKGAVKAIEEGTEAAVKSSASVAGTANATRTGANAARKADPRDLMLAHADGTSFEDTALDFDLTPNSARVLTTRTRNRLRDQIAAGRSYEDLATEHNVTPDVVEAFVNNTGKRARSGFSKADFVREIVASGQTDSAAILRELNKELDLRNLPRTSAKELAAELSRARRSAGIPSMNKPLTQDEIDSIRTMRENGTSVETVAKRLGRSVPTITKARRENNIPSILGPAAAAAGLGAAAIGGAPEARAEDGENAPFYDPIFQQPEIARLDNGMKIVSADALAGLLPSDVAQQSPYASSALNPTAQRAKLEDGSEVILGKVRANDGTQYTLVQRATGNPLNPTIETLGVVADYEAYRPGVGRSGGTQLPGPIDGELPPAEFVSDADAIDAGREGAAWGYIANLGARTFIPALRGARGVNALVPSMLIGGGTGLLAEAVNPREEKNYLDAGLGGAFGGLGAHATYDVTRNVLPPTVRAIERGADAIGQVAGAGIRGGATAAYKAAETLPGQTFIASNMLPAERRALAEIGMSVTGKTDAPQATIEALKARGFIEEVSGSYQLGPNQRLIPVAGRSFRITPEGQRAFAQPAQIINGRAPPIPAREVGPVTSPRNLADLEANELRNIDALNARRMQSEFPSVFNDTDLAPPPLFLNNADIEPVEVDPGVEAVIRRRQPKPASTPPGGGTGGGGPAPSNVNPNWMDDFAPETPPSGSPDDYIDWGDPTYRSPRQRPQTDPSLVPALERTARARLNKADVGVGKLREVAAALGENAQGMTKTQLVELLSRKIVSDTKRTTQALQGAGISLGIGGVVAIPALAPPERERASAY